MILSGNNLTLTDAIRSAVNEKIDRLFTHESHIIRIRVELGFSQNASKEDEFFAKGYIEIKGPPLIAAAEADDLYKAIDEMVDKLDRMLRRRSRLRRVKRKVPHSVEIPAEIPKAQVAS